jgi:hypothetical protein
MNGWSERDLAPIGAADEILVAPMTSDSAAENTLQLEPAG